MGFSTNLPDKVLRCRHGTHPVTQVQLSLHTSVVLVAQDLCVVPLQALLLVQESLNGGEVLQESCIGRITKTTLLRCREAGQPHDLQCDGIR